MDFKYVIKNKINHSFFDFKNIYIKYLNSISSVKEKYIFNDFRYILIISNIDLAKNIFSIFYSYRIKKLLTEYKAKKIILLTTNNNRFLVKFLFFLSSVFKIQIVTDNSFKMDLIKNCQCLYIPSVTEYLPLVSLEAIAFNKNIHTLYHIPTLNEYKHYKFFKK